MATTAINNVSIWSNGTSTSCNEFQLRAVSDDLTTAATFYYQVGVLTPATEEAAESFSSKTDGNLTCSGNDYSEWANNLFSTDWILEWGCEKLNLTKN